MLNLERYVGVGLALPRMVQDRFSQGTASRPPTILFSWFPGVRQLTNMSDCPENDSPPRPPLHSGRNDAGRRPAWRFAASQFFPESHVPESRQFNQRSPHGVHQMVFNEQLPEPVGPLI